MSGAGRPRLPAWLLGILVLTGCAEEFGPEDLPTTRVKGHIRISERPVRGGWVEFVPFGATKGSTRTTPLRDDGTFETDGVPVGSVVIAVSHPDPGQPMEILGPFGNTLDARTLFDSFRSPIRRVIPPEGAADLAIDLREEAIRYLVDRQSKGS